MVTPAEPLAGNQINALRWLTASNRPLEPQKLFGSLANPENLFARREGGSPTALVRDRAKGKFHNDEITANTFLSQVPDKAFLSNKISSP